MKLHHTALLLAALLAGACSDSTGSDDTPPLPGNYRGTLRGEVSRSSQGTAYLGGGLLPENTVTLYLTDDRAPREATQLVLKTTARPVPGTYAVGPIGGAAPFGANFAVFDATTGQATRLWAGESGTVTVDEATQDAMRGSYDVTLRSDVVAGQRTTVRATGRFDAARSNIP
jgi:hypothetical protein